MKKIHLILSFLFEDEHRTILKWAT